MSEIKFFEKKNNKIQEETTLRVPLSEIFIGFSDCFSLVNDYLEITKDIYKFNFPNQDSPIEIQRNGTIANFVEKKKILVLNLSRSLINSLSFKIKNNRYFILFFIKMEEVPHVVLSELRLYSIIHTPKLVFYSKCISEIKERSKPDMPSGDSVDKIIPSIINIKWENEVSELNREVEIVKSTVILEDTKTSLKSPKKEKIHLKRTLQAVTRNGKKPKIDFNRKYLYSPSPTNSIEITDLDLICLAPKEYLNDNIINFYLTYIYNEILPEEQRNAAYFFNVFFNTNLIGTEAQQKVDTPSSRHARVAKWTKKVDIFSKDYIVIPVIEDDHWFLVIVCFPWMAGIINYTELYKQKLHGTIPPNNTEFAKKYRVKKCFKLSEKNKITAMPCIIIFDSLEGVKRSKKLNIIREYLKSEWDSRRSAHDGPLIFDQTTCRGYAPRILKHEDVADCGLYLLQYVESFFKNPMKSFTKADMASDVLFEWFDRKDIKNKREHIRSIIRTKTTEMICDDNGDDNIV